MANEICRCPVVEDRDSYAEQPSLFAKIAFATNSNLSSFADAAGADPPLKRLPRLLRKIEGPNHWSPTQLEVDSYINSLELELLQGYECKPERQGKDYKGAAPVKDRPSNSFTLVWWVVAMAAGCFWWLGGIILQALN